MNSIGVPLVSVVVPTYNRATLLKECLDSLSKQTFRDFEVVVVDDGSTDDTRSVVESFAGTLDVRLGRTNRRGPGGARNEGARLAKGRYLAFLDSDDVWFPWTLSLVQKQIKNFQGKNEIIIYLTPKIFQTVSELRTLSPDDEVVRIETDVLTPQGSVYIGSNAIAAVSKSMFDEIGGFQEGHVNVEDVDFALRIGPKCKYIDIRSPVCLAYRKHGNQLTKDYERIYGGWLVLMGNELAGRYPGGGARRQDRERWISFHARAATRMLARTPRRWRAWEIFSISLPMNLRQRKWPFIVLFPAIWTVNVAMGSFKR